MKSVIIITIFGIFIIGNYFISDSFAVDFTDSTGYSASWAKGSGYYTVLQKCDAFTGDYSRDANWCMEWMAYVLDQGVENFPQSTQGTISSSVTHSVSQRVCEENKLCAVSGDYLKYRTWDTYDESSEIAIVEFKEKINEDIIRVFVDGFGSKPLTYNLNLKTGIETHDEYTGVNRPFNLLEPIPMKIGQKVSQTFVGYYDTNIEAERVANLKELGLPIDIERTIMAADADLENGDIGVYAYDKETGILITHAEKYQLEGKEYNSGAALIETNIFSVPTIIDSKTKQSNEEKMEIIQPNKAKPEQEIKQESGTKLSDPAADALVAFVILGISAIIIGLFIVRRKMKKAKMQKIRDSEWKGV
ncbi:MAG: hypothetical protein CO032_00030 [Nitrosopumilales archaeon CG_4_9_14_0_2_um_filter_34_16]|nr:MAG: hypothetical protein CO032_00030 [Nitrosopumilales archaeon CG_4_9_14_0_2_um_filter_34_16]